MDTQRFRDWYASKLETCDHIVDKFGESSYPDAEILLCCATSALTAQMWPGLGIDKQRYTEFLVDFAPDRDVVTTVSVPVLVAKLSEANRAQDAAQLKRAFYPEHRLQLLTTHEVDQDEIAIRQILPSLPLGQIRESSFAGIFYADFRSALVHEYSLSPYLRSFNLVGREDIPSYVNMSMDVDEASVMEIAQSSGISEAAARSALARSERFLHLPYEFVRDVLSATAQSSFDYWDGQSTWNRSAPSRWWILG